MIVIYLLQLVSWTIYQNGLVVRAAENIVCLLKSVCSKPTRAKNFYTLEVPIFYIFEWYQFYINNLFELV